MDVTTLFDEFEKLPPISQKTLYDLIYPVVKSSSNRIGDYIGTIREIRFSHGMVCPHCGSVHVIGHGKYRSRQRYKCKDCSKTFNDVSCSPMAGTHYPQKWGEYLQFIAEGTTLPKIARTLDISLSTAFYWRHKVLNSLRSMDVDTLSGIVESDETFFSESFKGKNQCKSRDPHHRGEKSQYRGLSREKTCVLVAMDRAGHILSQNAGMGIITGQRINELMGEYITQESVLCTDSAQNYKKFAKLRGLECKQVNASKKKHVVEKIYHIQHVNNYHGRLKRWIDLHFNGVATKYMDNYLFWHRFLELSKAMDKTEFKKNLLTHVLAIPKTTTVKDIRPVKTA